jgi:hypothetical protein
VNLPQDEKNNIVKVAIKQRPFKGSHSFVGGMNAHYSNPNHAKSVEERKEEYNKTRARIFNISSSTTSMSKSVEDESAAFDNCQFRTLVNLKFEDKPCMDDVRTNHAKAMSDGLSGIGRINRPKVEREANKAKNNRVAIFRDREIDHKDPDYDYSYDRY